MATPIRSCLLGALLAGGAVSASHAVPVTLSALTGLAGGSPAGTKIYKADLSSVGLATILSIGISDDSGGIGGSPGQFSGFDLDAIKLSTTDCGDATCAAGLAGLGVFDFGLGTLFTPGAQLAPLDPKLFGTGAAGNTVDNLVATLNDFDADSTTAVPGADGFISMGFGGILNFNLSAATSTSGLFLYIGEVGDNGEVAASNVVVRPTLIPEPGALALLALGGGLLLASRRRAT